MVVEYLSCPFCTRTKPISKTGEVPFTEEIDPLAYQVYQIRIPMPGPGRGHKLKGEGGFQRESGETIEELMSTHPELAEVFRKRLLTIVTAYLDAGVITREELG